MLNNQKVKNFMVTEVRVRSPFITYSSQNLRNFRSIEVIAVIAVCSSSSSSRAFVLVAQGVSPFQFFVL